MFLVAHLHAQPGNMTTGKTVNKVTFCLPGWEDNIADWWSHLVAVAAYWLLNDISSASALYHRIESPDITLQVFIIYY